MKYGARILAATGVAAAFLAAWMRPATARGQNGPPSSSQESSSSTKTPSQPKGTQPAAAASPDGSDPVSRRINNSAPAEHDVEVGQYYMKREKYDAAIDRFVEATKLMPDYAQPYKLIGEAYEKKKFLPEARQAYQKYLTLKISPKDAAEIEKRVERLDGEIQDQERRRAEATKPQG